MASLLLIYNINPWMKLKEQLRVSTRERLVEKTLEYNSPDKTLVIITKEVTAEIEMIEVVTEMVEDIGVVEVVIMVENLIQGKGFKMKGEDFKVVEEAEDVVEVLDKEVEMVGRLEDREISVEETKVDEVVKEDL